MFGQSKAVTYAATKGAITSFTKALAIDEVKHGVRVNSVSPGNIWTPLWKVRVEVVVRVIASLTNALLPKAWSEGEKDPNAASKLGDSMQIMGRKGTIEETGLLCLFIAAEATFTTGVDHIQSGGAELGYGVKD